ncbi:MAG: hypothetical protein ACM3NP_13595 [Actinomycetota bacterium]
MFYYFKPIHYRQSEHSIVFRGKGHGEYGFINPSNHPNPADRAGEMNKIRQVLVSSREAGKKYQATMEFNITITP